MIQRFCAFRWIGVVASAALLGLMVVLVAAADDAATPLRRYRLEVGQQIQYEGGGNDKYSDGTSSRTEGHWEFDVIGHCADGNFRLLFRMTGVSTQIDLDGKEQRTDEPVTVAFVDMDTVGNITELFHSIGYRSNPAMDFPPLPADAKQLADGWQSAGSLGSTMHYRALPESNSKEFVFSIEENTPFNAIYDSHNSRTITFDAERGLPIKYSSTDKWGYRVKSEGSGEYKLVDVQIHDADWAAKLKADAEQYFLAKQQFNKATENDEATAESLDQAVASFKESREKITSADFQQQIDRELDDFQKYRSYQEERNADRKSMLGQAAEEFTTTDLDDKAQALADYRGKVVLLDFWYRGCGWCIRSMPALKKVGEHYAGQPVALLGMNTDRDLDDAKFVVDKLGLNYPNLKAEGLPTKFKVHGFPTMILIDQTGKIRDIHAGWTPTLEQDMIDKIDRLLAEAK